MRPILAIDPGETKSAWVLFDVEKKIILNCGITENNDFIAWLFETEMDLAISYVVIEMIQGMGMAVGKETFTTCVWIGRFIQALEMIPHHLIYRTTIKGHLCGTTQAKDPNIRRALLDKYGPQGTKKNPGPTYGIKDDIWSALAVATVFTERELKK